MSNVASLFLLLTTGEPGMGEKKILGEATDAKYKHEIEVQGWNWDLTRSHESSELTKIGSRIPPPPNSVVPSVLTFEKSMCRATSGMLAAMRTGELLTAVFSLEEDSDLDFLLVLTLKRVRILEYELSINDNKVDESWKLNYEEIRFDYRPSDQGGELTVKLTRHAGASTKASSKDNTEEKIRELANKLEPSELKPLLKSLEADMNRPGARKETTSKSAGVGKT
ncbi:MAG: type VI secretion system tube protein Hcp [Caldimonas sp.]